MRCGVHRRAFLTGQVTPELPAMTPPGSGGDFLRLCDGCGACADACSAGIIVKGKVPTVDFDRGACTFCGECIAACPTDALEPERLSDWPWRGVIIDNCLSLNGIACRACEDACDLRAIRFRLMTGGRSAPVLDQSQCTGCGECAFTCPAEAIRFKLVEASERETLQ
ncbi:ferredoxin-type protein NapF [Donghicola sp. B5-SW-15]|uniref:Ferredoxin-type protein NapF n=2 Tax=Donghicola mangrovi TaxID=2729614 RepID=A0A850QEG4_9RHOB|nr:ferredoxin-type protein NapF [Donghicola mangrovi]